MKPNGIAIAYILLTDLITGVYLFELNPAD